MKRVAIAVALLAISLGAAADYTADFQAARRLFDEREYAEAAKAFGQLAENAPNARGEVWSLSFAARALGLDGQYEEAIALAQSIGPRWMAAYTQMEIMGASRKHEELVAAFAEEEGMDRWPDEVNYKCFFLRGAALAATGGRDAAADDMRMAADLAGSDTETKLDALGRLGALLRETGDEQEAMAAYREALALFDKEPTWKGRWLYPRTILGAASLLTSQGKHDEATAILGRREVNPDKKGRGPWDFRILEAHGDIAAAQGKTDEALARYREAVEIDTHDSYVQRVQAKIEELEE